ncbi:MAG: hypothetical protein ACLR6A_01555 [Candidatus Gastranaerophilaceae bacterium]
MKKILCAIAVVTTVSLMGCGTVQKENPAGTTQEQKVSETTAQEITEMKNEETENESKTTEGRTAEVKTTENQITETEVNLEGIHPDAVKEIQNMLDEVNANVSVNDKADSEEVIRQAINLMALAAGNSLVENQVQLVVQDWKQNHKAELSDFQKKMEVVYKEYEMLAAGDTEAELKKAGFTLEGYEYCGNGKLDMVEWIYSDIQS